MAVDGYCYPCGVEYENACPGPDDTSATMQPHPTLSYACISSGTIYAASLYWSVMTITSIGYGDIYPRSVAAKTFTMFYAPPGIVLTGVYYVYAGRLINILSFK